MLFKEYLNNILISAGILFCLTIFLHFAAKRHNKKLIKERKQMPIEKMYYVTIENL